MKFEETNVYLMEMKRHLANLNIYITCQISHTKPEMKYIVSEKKFNIYIILKFSFTFPPKIRNHHEDLKSKNTKE